MRESGDASAELQELAADYEIIGRLGSGSSAVVYRARDRALERDVAIKVVHARGADEDLLERAAQEARLLARLPHHPNIVTIYAVRRLASGGLALVVQYVAGRTLREALRDEGAFEPQRAARVMRDLARALHFAHGHGIVHRDVKPENVYLEDSTGRALLSDFGAATLLDQDTRLTAVGTVIGTPAYMSPEQLAGLPVDGRSDLYSLGLVGWEMLTGLFPWGTTDLYEILYRQRHADVPPMDTVRPGLPAPLVNAVEGALERDPERRWPSAAALLSALLSPPDVPRLPRRATRETAAPAIPVAAIESQHAQTVEVDHAASPVTAAPSSLPAAAGGERGGGASWPLTPPGPRRHAEPRPTRRRWPRVAAVAALVAILAAAGLWTLGGGRDARLARDDAAEARTRAGEVAMEQDLVADLAAAAVAVGDGARQEGDSLGPVAGERVDPLPERPGAGGRATPPAGGDAGASAPPAAAPPRSRADSMARCASPALADQRACLLARLNEHDAELNRVYGRLIGAMWAEAGVAAGAPDPPAVRQLRAEQRAWLVERDTACQRQARGREGPLWAPERARCLGDLGTERARVLAARLERLG